MGFPGCGRREGSVERPWGWIVMVAAFLVHILSYGLAWSTGVLNAIFLDTFDVPVVYISWVGTLVLGNMLASGVLAGIAINRFGCRMTALLGGALTSGGLVLSFFAPNVYFLYFSLGTVTGFGGGFSFLASVSAVTHWFDERRSIALGVTSAGLGFGQFLFPALIRWLYQTYDWTGVLLILGGISLNIIVGGATFRPTVFSGRREKPLPDEDESPQTHFHCHVFKNPGFLSMCLNNVLLCFGLSIMYIHLPAYGESVGIDPNRSALLMSAMGLANVFGRVSYGVFDQYFTQKTCILYGSSFVLAGVIVAVVPTTDNYTLQVVFSALFGFVTGSFGVLLAQIVAQLVGVTDFAAAYGYLLLFEGLGTMSGGPTAGFLYDETHTYTTSLYVSGASLVLSAACVVLPHIIIVRPKLGPQISVQEPIPASRSSLETSA